MAEPYLKCESCGSLVTRDRIKGRCAVCGRLICSNCARLCEECLRLSCPDCIRTREVWIQGRLYLRRICDACWERYPRR